MSGLCIRTRNPDLCPSPEGILPAPMPHGLSFTGFVLTNLRRRRLRTLLTLAGIGMAVGAFVGLVGFSRGFEQEWMRIYSGAGTDLAVIEQTFLSTSMDQSVVERVQRLPFVANATPLIFNLMDLTQDVNAIAFGWKADSYEFQSLDIQAGRNFRDGQREIMLGDLLAANLKKAPGDTLEIQGTPFQVVGVFHATSALEAGAVLLPLDQMQKLNSLEGKITTVHVRLKSPPAGLSTEAWQRQAQAQIEAVLPGMRAVPAADRAGNNQLVRLAHASAWGTSLIALLIGVLGIANTMAMSVFERTREIGILRAIGWPRRQVVLLIQAEAAALGLCGGCAGLAIGLGALRILARVPQTAGVVTASVPILLLAEALGIAVLAGLVAGALPAWRAAQLSPVDALRND